MSFRTPYPYCKKDWQIWDQAFWGLSRISSRAVHLFQLHFLIFSLYYCILLFFITNFWKITVFECNFLILLILPEGLILKKWVSRAKKKRVEEGREKMMSQERYINIKRSKVNNILGPAYIVNLHTLKSVLKIRFYVISLQQFSVQTFLIWQITW